MVGHALFDYMVFGRIPLVRLTGALVLAAISPLMIHLVPLATAIAAAIVLAGIAISDVVRSKGRPPKPPAPPH